MSISVTFESVTPRFQLPNLFPGQAQKEFFVNEALGKIDGLLHLAVEGEQSSPPPSYDTNQCWIIAANATGEWTGHEGKLALGSQAGWDIIEPAPSMLIFDKSLFQFRRFENGWQQASEPTAPQGGTTVDAEARTAISELIEVLRIFGLIPST